MKQWPLLLAATLFLAAAPARAQLPRLVTDGFETYIANGVAEGLNAWLRGSPLQDDAAARQAVTGVLTQAEAAYGKVQGYDVIGEVELSGRVRRIYAIEYHAQGPVFASFDLFRATSGWLVYALNFNLKAEAVLPADTFLPGTKRPG